VTLRRSFTIIALLIPGLGLILAMIGSVFYVAVMQSFGFFNLTGENVFSLEHWQDVLDSRAYWRALQYSAYVAVISSIGSVLLAYPLAIWLRRPFRGSMVVSGMLKAPYFVPGLVAAFLFLNVVAFHGVLNQFLMWIGVTDAPIRFQNDRNAIGLLFLQIWKNLPLALILLTGAVQSISDEVLDAARDLGAGKFDRFRKVIAPLTVRDAGGARDHLHRRRGRLRVPGHRGPHQRPVHGPVHGVPEGQFRALEPGRGSGCVADGAGADRAR
jgi:putative spermidine/putrescine transport system permease protein